MAEQAWRPRPCGYAHRRSGSPWVPVRPYYEGLPSKEGQYGSDEGRRKPPGSRGMKVPRSGPDERGPGVEDATGGAPEGGVPRKARGHLHQGARLRWCATSALRSLTQVREKGKEGGPRASPKTGAMNHVCRNEAV